MDEVTNSQKVRFYPLPQEKVDLLNKVEDLFNDYSKVFSEDRWSGVSLSLNSMDIFQSHDEYVKRERRNLEYYEQQASFALSDNNYEEAKANLLGRDNIDQRLKREMFELFVELVDDEVMQESYSQLLSRTKTMLYSMGVTEDEIDAKKVSLHYYSGDEEENSVENSQPEEADDASLNFSFSEFREACISVLDTCDKAIVDAITAQADSETRDAVQDLRDLLESDEFLTSSEQLDQINDDFWREEEKDYQQLNKLNLDRQKYVEQMQAGLKKICAAMEQDNELLEAIGYCHLDQFTSMAKELDLVNDNHSKKFKKELKEAAKESSISAEDPEQISYEQTFSEKLRNTIIYAISADDQFPQDVNGSNVFSNLENHLHALDQKAANHQDIIDWDYDNVAKDIFECIKEAPVFTSDLPNGKKDIGQEKEMLTTLRDQLSAMASRFPENQDIVDLADQCESIYADRFEAEYEKYAKIAFTGRTFAEGSEQQIAWNKLTSLKNLKPEFEERFQKDRLALMVVNPQFCAIQINEATSTLRRMENSGIPWLNNENDLGINGPGLNPADRALNEENETVFGKIFHYDEVKKDAALINIFGFGLALENQAEISEAKTEESAFIYGKSSAEKQNLAKPYPDNRDFALQRVDAFLEKSSTIPELQDNKHNILSALSQDNTKGLSEKQLRSLTPEQAKSAKIDAELCSAKMGEQFKSSCKTLADTYGYSGLINNEAKKNMVRDVVSNAGDDLNLDYQRLSTILKKGSKEANALRTEVISYRDKVKAGETPSTEDKLKLFRAASNYAHLKSSVPFTQSGKDRLKAATEILAKVGNDLLRHGSETVKNICREEIQLEILRNPEFREEMRSKAIQTLEARAGVFEATEMISFIKLAESSIKDPKGYIDMKLDTPDSVNKIRPWLAKANASAKNKTAKMMDKSVEEILDFAKPKVSEKSAAKEIISMF